MMPRKQPKETSKFDEIIIFLEKEGKDGNTKSVKLSSKDRIHIPIYCGGVLTYTIDIISTHMKGDGVTKSGVKFADYRPVMYVNERQFSPISCGRLPFDGGGKWRVPKKFINTYLSHGGIFKIKKEKKE